MVGNTKELSCISAITLDFPAICKAYFAHAPATKKRGGLSAATSAPQISVGYTIDCLSYAVPVFYEFSSTVSAPVCTDP